MFNQNLKSHTLFTEKDFKEHKRERKEIEKFRDFTFINCWTINRNESFALWKIYLGGARSGVAIKSTVGKLKKSLKEDSPDLFIGKVNYTDRFSKYPPSKEQLTLTKMPFYTYEDELRVFYTAPDDFESLESDPVFEEFSGWYTNINILELIDKIYLSPFAGHWLRSAIKSILYKVEPLLLERLAKSDIKDE